MFPSLDEKHSLSQIVILNRGLLGDDYERIEIESKRMLIATAALQGILRSQLSDARDRFEWSTEYLEKQKHFNFKDLILQF